MKNFKLKLGSFGPVIKNASWLTLFEILRMVMPFIALPYIISVVGMENNGRVVFVQSIIPIFALFVNLGLDISAVKDVAVYRHDQQQLNRIVSTVISIKLLMCVVSFLLMYVVLLLVPQLGALSLIFYFAFIACISDIFLPVWYFQGKEEMKKLTIIRFFAITFYTASIFLWIRQPDDYPYIALLNSVSLVLSSLIACYFVFVKDKIRFQLPPLSFMIKAFKASSPFFMSRISLTININMAKIMSYFFFSGTVVTSFEIAQKIVNGGMMPVQMFSQALYPNLSHSQDKRMLRSSFGITALFTTGVSVFVFLIAGIAVRLLSHGLAPPEAVVILRILCVFLFFSGFSVFMGSSALVAFGHQKPFNMSVVWSTVILIACYGVIIATNHHAGYMYALALVAAELMVCGYRFYACRKYGLLSLKNLRGYL